MDSGTQKLLESVTLKTLHVHSFSRSSTQASLVLTDLLSRYISLLSSTCAKYAQHSGRTSLTIHDAVVALDELGVNLEELSEYCATEGRELNRYALHSTRRVEDLNEFRAQLSEGLRQDRNDAINLEYARYSPPPLSDDSEYEDEEIYEIDEDFSRIPALDDMDVDIIPSTAPPLSRKPSSLRPTSPILPLSPISNPSSSPSRKRPRTADWHPPEHIPDFLPPFPTMELPPARPEDVKMEKPLISLSQQPVTTAAASDFFVQVPYSQSSLSNLSEKHLPQAPRGQSSSLQRTPRLAVPQTEPSLFAAYHHILTHPPPAVPPPSNPSRHRVAMSFLTQIQNHSRWDPPDTLFSSVQPCPPRATPVAPTHPIPIDPIFDIKGKDKDIKLPPTKPRPVAANERLSPLISQQASRLPDLSRHVLHPAIFARTTRLSHPPVLHTENKALIYGSGVPAPWNRKPPPDASTPANAKAKDVAAEQEPEGKLVIPDAQMYATWDYTQKNYKVPINSHSRSRGRMGSMQAGGSGVISLPAISRSKGNK
ncbi:hypothetical protein BDQ17DRAFT_1372146 [Cyathus striatus]|nr:hypothetical protein BDQ17DRAFT_1372146 [Cyathus striatus]